MKLATTLSALALACVATSAQAQDVPTSPPPQVPPVDVPGPMPPEPVPPADRPAAEAEGRAFTDEEIAAFAHAGTQMQALREDATLDAAAREARAQAIVAEAGIDPDTYRAIGRAAQADPALAMRVQLAVEAMRAEPGN